MTDLLVLPAVTFHRDPVLEATGTGAARQIQRAGAASAEAIAARIKLERETTQQLLKRLATLKAALQKRLLVDVNLTDFKAFTVKSLTDDVDRMIHDATAGLATSAEQNYQAAGDLGMEAIDQPIKSTGLTISPALPGLDPVLVQAAFGNTVDLLTPPMQQFGSQVKQALRGVALAGDSKQGAINRLRDQIGGAGFDTAAFKAERIIRTELGRTFNAATYDRLVTLSADFPFLKKGWRASRDNRTRTGHREAAAKYARGDGTIPITQSFAVNVYDERPGKPAVLIGVCLLRFPVDPQAQPAGRIAAACTILCRCNGFVDFDLADFAAYTKKAIQQIVPGVPAGTGVPPVTGPTKPTMQHKPKPVKATGVRVPKAKDVVPSKSAGPSGKPVTDALNFAPQAVGSFRKPLAAGPLAKIQKAYQVLNSVHGDGELPVIPVQQVPIRDLRKGVQAYFSRSRAGQPVALAYGPNITKNAPNMGVFHETGHFLDYAAFDSPANVAASEGSAAFDQWRAAVQGSKAMQSLKDWRDGKGRPMGASDHALDYLLSGRETWARSYAQYVAVKSGDKAALKELRNMQAASTTGAVDQQTRYNRNTMGQAPIPGSWDYPWAWSDEDFKPIEAAIDAILEGKGWRKR